MGKVFLVDLARCNGCRNCQVACKDEYCDNDWSPYAKPQPEIGQFWMSITEKTRGQVPVVKVSYLPMLCAHCEDAPCAKVCSQGAFERRDEGLLYIVPDKCNGCMECVSKCPLGVLYANENLKIAQKCAGCAHLLDDGWVEPRCVDACPTSALKFGDEEDFAEELKGAQPLDAVASLGSHVFYLNMPKRFVAGCVVDRGINEVLIGARVTLEDEAGNEVASVLADDFGDYKFDQIEPARYTVRINAEGYAPLFLAADVTKEDLFLGNHFMEKQ